MQSRLQVIVVAAVLAFPAGLGAQHIGFRVGIAPPRHGPVVPFGGAVYPYGAYDVNPFSGLRPGGNVVPARPYAPAASVVRAGPIIFVNGLYGQRVSPGLQIVTPAVVIGNGGVAIVNGANRRGRSYRSGNRAGFLPGFPVIPPHAGGVFGSGRHPGYGPLPAISHGFGVGIGSTRAAVLAQYGTPTVSTVNANGEMLIYGGAIYLIQNGIVTRVTGR